MWGKYFGFGAVGCVGLGFAFLAWNELELHGAGASQWNLHQVTEVLTPQFFADEDAAASMSTQYQDEEPWDDGLRASFQAVPIDGSIESRPDELLRSAEGVGDVDEDGRDKGRRSHELNVEAGNVSTDVS